MTLDITLKDPSNKQRGRISPSGEILIMDSGQPEFDGNQKVTPFRQYLTTDGTASGSNDMGVDGSTTNVDFYVPAHSEKDRYITHIGFIVAYGLTGQPAQWANGTALSNGCRLFYTNQEGEQDIHDAIKRNEDFFRLDFNGWDVNWEVRHIGATNDFGYFINLNFIAFGLRYGVKLSRGTNQRITMRIRDNAGADADTFNGVCYGFERSK